MDFQAFKRECLSHYAALSENPGFKAHAWHQVKAMAEAEPQLFGDLPELLTAEMLKRKEQK